VKNGAQLSNRPLQIKMHKKKLLAQNMPLNYNAFKVEN
jgi:hypothetical protein